MIDKVKNIIVSILFGGILVIVLIVNIFSKDKDISISERRRLASFPKFSVNNIFNGTFFSNFDKYAVDQFVMRDYIRENKVRLDLALKNNYHDVYVYNDYLIKQEYPLNESSLRNLIDIINSISNNYLNNSKNI